jgi:hypothetical protein
MEREKDEIDVLALVPALLSSDREGFCVGKGYQRALMSSYLDRRGCDC